MNQHVLAQYVIYDHPRDFPEHFVVRCWWIGSAGVIRDPEPYALSRTLDDARGALPEGLVRMVRMADDDPVIVEVWM